MPDLGTEAPDPAEQQCHRERSKQKPAPGAREVGARIEQAEEVQPLARQVVNALAALDDDLALADREADRHDPVGGLFARPVSGRGVERRIGHEQRREDLAGEHPLIGREARADAIGERATDVGQQRVAHLLALSGVEHARHFAAQPAPRHAVHRGERVAGRRRRARGWPRAAPLACIVGQGGGECRINRSDSRSKAPAAGCSAVS